MRSIPLTRGKVAIVDDADYEFLSQSTWHAWWSGSRWYALDGHRRYMHRVILGLTRFCDKGDHKDGDGLNNQRCNLRIATNSQNAANSKLRSTNRSGFRGVVWSVKESKWIAVIGPNIRIGCFSQREQAAIAYNEEAIKRYGEFAKLNTL